MVLENPARSKGTLRRFLLAFWDLGGVLGIFWERLRSLKASGGVLEASWLVLRRLGSVFGLLGPQIHFKTFQN